MTTLTIDPDLQPALNALQEFWGDTAMDLSDLTNARQTHNAMAEQRNATAPVTKGVESSRHLIFDADMGLEVPVYLHKFSELGNAPCNVLLHIHGGGLVVGAAAHAEPQLRALAKQFSCAVVSVDYRLAPEHPFPAALFDCVAVLKWLRSESETFGVNTQKIVVLGESAGGGIAAGMALYARDQNLNIEIAQQILLYPMLDCQNIDQVSDNKPDTVLWSRGNNKFGWAAYLADGVDDHMLSYASPNYAKDWQNIPPTYVCIGDIDLFYEENCKYVEQLRAASVNAEIDIYPDAYHAFQVAMPEAAVSQKCLQKLNSVLSKALS